MDKKNKEAQQFKQERLKLEKEIEEEHSAKIRFESELKELKREFEIMNSERRALSIKAQSLETSLNHNKRELSDLKRENAKLKEKNESVAWITKSEYDKLENLLKEKEKELERVLRDQKAP